MNGYQLIGPILFLFVFGDVILHVVLDSKKLRTLGTSAQERSDMKLPEIPAAAATFSTFLLFVMVFLLSVSWLSPMVYAFLVFIELFQLSWLFIVIGSLLCYGGIFLNGWARFVRRNMASSWGMRKDHRLVTTGPYARIRHPSYASYIICTIGTLLLIPSILTLLLLMTLPAYYVVSLHEEQLLISKFGDEYRRYMTQTSRFLPGF